MDGRGSLKIVLAGLNCVSGCRLRGGYCVPFRFQAASAYYDNIAHSPRSNKNTDKASVTAL